MRRYSLVILTALLMIGVAQFPAAPVSAAQNRSIGINVVLNTDITPALLADLGRFGNVLDTIEELDAVHMRAREADLAAIRALPYVEGANADAGRTGSPVDTVPLADFAAGESTWDQDAIDVTNPGVVRAVPQDGAGVYVAVLDTGLLDSWRQYFPQERIATEYAKAFGGGGQDRGTVSSPANMWEHDQNSHGTHVTSSILGFKYGARYINGAAPRATIIPVKILNQVGWGWSSVIARGIVYVADLKGSALNNAPVVISMSLGGPTLDAIEKKAIDYAISKGVVIVAAAGNEGNDGMGYPGAYAPVVSVAASGWIGEWTAPSWWRTLDVPEGDASQFYIADFSSRQKAGQQLDVAAPGTWVVGPYQVNSGQLSYYYLGGTSMATPHVSGIVALMLQKNPALVQADVESYLKASAIPLAPGCAEVLNAGHVCWGADATGAGLATAAGALSMVP
jgi:subtilisin family serine protease